MSFLQIGIPDIVIRIYGIKRFKSYQLLTKKQSNVKGLNMDMTSTKKELKRKENEDRLSNAISTLDNISKNSNIQRNIRNMIKEVFFALKDEKGGSVSVRAANAISMLDTITQNPQMQSHIRTMLWQVVSTLESIRE